METAATFLSNVLAPLRDNEVYFVVGLTSGIPDQTKQTSIEDIIARGNVLVRHELNAYMALSTFGAAEGRTAINSKRLQSVWVDLDVGKKNNSYASQEDAQHALQSFVQATQLPPTYIVSSGIGYHAYWCMDQSMESDQWVMIANYFRALCVQEGLIIDPACATDRARILRIPGTYHFKAERWVELLPYRGPIWNTKQFILDVGGKVKSIPAPVVDKKKLTHVYASSKLVDENIMRSYGLSEEPTADAAKIAASCAQIANMGLAQEPVWHRSMTVLKCCANGREWAHKLSAMDTERYNQQDTENKFNNANAAPTSCTKFNDLNPDVCTKCPHYGRITSPIQLDKYVIEEPVQEEVQVETQSVDRLVIPDVFPYDAVPYTAVKGAAFYQNDSGIYYQYSDNNGEPHTDLVCRARIKFLWSEMIKEQTEDPKLEYFFGVQEPTRKEQQIATMPVKIATNNGFLAAWMASFGMLPEVGQGKHLMAFMNAYLAQIVTANAGKRREKYKNYGWHHVIDPNTGDKIMGLVLEGTIITGRGALPAAHQAASDDNIHRVFTHKGTIEKWQAVTKMYEAFDQKLAQFAMCLALAAPLMKYGSGEGRNCVLNIYSRTGGRGKTALLKACASIWGNPMYSIVQKDTSIVARGKFLADYNNLPCCMDEITFLKKEDLNSLMFLATGGNEKQKLNVNSEFRQTGDWSTCTITTANRPVKDTVRNVLGDSDACVLRVMDFECDFQRMSGEHIKYIDDVFRIVADNYGVAGPEFIYQLLCRPERLAMLSSVISSWVGQQGFETQERFYSYAIGLAMWAGRCACEFGIWDFNMDQLELWVKHKFVPTIREHDLDLADNPVERLAEFLNATMIRNTLIVRRHDRLQKETPAISPGDPDAYVLLRPTAALQMRYELESNMLFISCTALRMWCDRNNYQYREFVNYLYEHQYITDKSSKINLGLNVPWLPPLRPRCVVLNPKKIVELINSSKLNITTYDNNVDNFSPSELLNKWLT